MTYENLICVYCQDVIMLGEGHTKVITENGTYHAHILCYKQSEDYKAEVDGEHELQQKYKNRLIKLNK